MVFEFIKEVFLVVYYPFASITNLFIRTAKASSENKKPIVMVERWFNSNPMHKHWKRYLEKQGFDVYLINFPIYKGTFEKSAEKLSEHIESLNLKKIILVGISSGGLTSLLYLEHYKGWEKVEKFITIATPFRGTPMAFFISFVKSGSELLPRSDFMKKFQTIEVSNKNRIVCLKAKFDEMVPSWSSCLDGVKTETINKVGHNNFHLNSEYTYKRVAEISK